MKKLSIVFFGTPDFSVPTLEALHNHPRAKVSCVVSMPDRPAGRGKTLKSPEVIEFAKKNKIPTIQTENINKYDGNNLNLIESADVFIVLAFAQFLSQRVLDMPKKGCFNIHTSLLPKYRGAAPIQYAILNGDSTTGVSIQKMVKKMDAGDLVASHSVSIAKDETGGQLYSRLKFQAALTTNDFLNNLSESEIEFTPQNEKNVSFAPTLKKEDGLINFKEESAYKIHNKIRALYPWPGTSFELDSKRVKVIRAQLSDQPLKPRETKIEKNRLFIGCNEGSIEILELQFEGKKASDTLSFINGYKGEYNIQ